MAVIKCKMCGGNLEIQEGQSVGICEYCGTKQTLPKLTSDKKANMYDRASHFRRNNDYDKAMGIYEQILNEDNTDAEAYWSLVLCRYGIEYVEDPATHKRVPTVNRAQYTSIFADEDYKSALANADAEQKAVYEAEAKAIDEIQKGILEISQKEEPFDVFICYKETDANGRRTPDSVLSNDLYHQLTQEGFKVFFAKITLEDKLGQEYEPYIFAALNSAKVMVVLGTKPEHFNAVWVKNEWSRYLALIRNGAKKVLIPAYRDMDPYDLPEEFSHLQAQDMSKLGFMQDLIRGIKKITVTEETKPVQETVVVQQMGQPHDEVAPLLRRAELYLEDGDWSSADEYCERVLDMEPENPYAYLYKLLAELKCHRVGELREQGNSFENSNNCQKVFRFADDPLREKLQESIEYIRRCKEKQKLLDRYNQAVERMHEATSEEQYNEAAQLFDQISEFCNAKQMSQECLKQAEIKHKEKLYLTAKEKQKKDTIWSLQKAIEDFSEISDWENSAEQIEICQKRIQELKNFTENKRISERKKAKRDKTIKIVMILTLLAGLVALVLWLTVIKPSIQYKEAISLLDAGEYDEAITAFGKLGSYRDSQDRKAEAIWGKIEEKQIIEAEEEKKRQEERSKQLEQKAKQYAEAERLLLDGQKGEAAILFGKIDDYQDARVRSFILWNEIVQKKTVSAGPYCTVAIRNDNTVVTTKNLTGRAATCIPNDGLPAADWTDVISISTGAWHTVGLRSDGTILYMGTDLNDCSKVSDWTDVVAISAGEHYVVGVLKNGDVRAVGTNNVCQCNVTDWENIVDISAATYHTIGLCNDGTVMTTGSNDSGQRNTKNWENIVAVSAGEDHSVGLKSDGTVVAVGSNKHGQCNVEDWTDIVDISAGDGVTVGLRRDGRVLATGYNHHGQCNTENWKNIVSISASSQHTVGLCSDGTVVATHFVESSSTGEEGSIEALIHEANETYQGQCEVGGWKNIKMPENKER